MQKIKADNKYREKELINGLEISDGINPNKKLLLSTDTEHVQDRTGRSSEEIKCEFYKQFCREFTADSTGKISVSNGMKGHVLSGTIEGQTVKNYLPNVADWTYKSLEDGKLKITTGYAYYEFKGTLPFKSETAYDIVVYVSKNTLNKEMPIYNSYNGFFQTSLKLSVGQTGLIRYTLNTVIDIQNPVSKRFVVGSNDDTRTGEVIIDWIAIVDNGTGKLVTGAIPVGLSSTQVMVNSNSIKYSFYEPTIQGKTRVLKATKGTQTWTEISADETRNTTTYDYKLDSINGDLGSVRDSYNVLYRATKYINYATKEISLNESLNYALSSTTTDTVRFSIAVDNPKVANAYITTVSNNFKSVSYNEYSAGKYECVFIHTSGKLEIEILKSKLTTPDVTGFKSWLQANPTTVRYQLATPQEIPLTDEQLKAYDVYKTPISLGGLEGARNTLEIKEDGSAIYTGKTIKILVNGSESIIKESTWDSNGFVAFRINLTQQIDANTKQINCDKYKVVALGLSTENNECIQIISSSQLGFKISSTKVTTVDELKTFLGNNTFVIEPKLATPIVTIIPKELVPLILTDKINNFSVESPVAPSSLTLNVPTSDDINKSYNNLVLLNGFTQTVGTATPIINLSNTGIVRLQMDLTTPATGINTTLFTLPTELRPVTSARIPVFVNGICQLATIDKTTGNVNLTSTPEAGANIYIKTDYRRDI